jgi:hypothetical protein
MKLIANLNNCDVPSRRSALKAKQALEEPHICLTCYETFECKKQFKKHVKKEGHRVTSKDICEEYKDAHAEFKEDPNCLLALEKMIESLEKVTLLEKLN